jgi:hypothetical protein
MKQPRNRSDELLAELFPNGRYSKAEYEGARAFILDVIRDAGYENATVAGKAWAEHYRTNATADPPWFRVTGNPKVFLDVIRQGKADAYRVVPVTAVQRALWAISLLAEEAFARHPVSNLPESESARWWPSYITTFWIAKRGPEGIYVLEIHGSVDQCAQDARDHLERLGLVTSRKREEIKEGLREFLLEHAWNLFLERNKKVATKAPAEPLQGARRSSANRSTTSQPIQSRGPSRRAP